MLIARVEAVDSASKDCMAADADRSITGCTAVLRRSKETRSNRAKALYNRGIALRDKGDLDRALVDFDEAIQLNPKNANAFYNRGITYRDKAIWTGPLRISTLPSASAPPTLTATLAGGMF